MRRRRVFVEDERDDGRYLRMTWHREKTVFVLSTWTGDVCTGSVRIPVERAPEVIGLLADGLGDAVTHPAVPVEGAEERSPNLFDRLAGWLGVGRPGKRKSSRSAGQTATILNLR